MASIDVRQPLLSGRTDLNPQTRSKDTPKRKRFRRSKSAPLADFVPFEKTSIGSDPQSNAIFGNIHPNICKVFMFLAFYLSAATVCFYIVRNQITGKKTNGVLDAVYFCIVTMTTVGYGDLVPSSDAAKVLACAFVFTGMALVCLILSNAADYLVEKQEILLVRALHLRKKVAYTEILKEAAMNRTRYKCILAFVILLVLMITGTIFLSTVEKLDLVDAFYCVCSTITTLGYGDKSFSTKGGRVFAVFWILISTICLAQFFLYIAELNTENRQRELVEWVLTRKVTNLDLEAADLDHDGNVDLEYNHEVESTRDS
ncbi:two-pore potassium channel 1 isoform X2 [Morus notabilis]|uniref:two-pore potassium channel 1 isoform X2 n=1 Tax=Morus notabilis TaxID=981085 RepID=UPI000CED6C07|nr:two-pore potassium channel 1 isoform X2 [Morus notabilis]